MKSFLLPIAFLSILLISTCFQTARAQLNSIDHWETVVSEEQTWRYFVGNSAPPANWNEASFNDGGWAQGPGGIGYGDGDDNTNIPVTLSLFMRRTFQLVDTSLIIAFALHADYDDAFVAYLNGVEIARSNIGERGDRPAYNQPSDGLREAQMYFGGDPEGFLILKSNWRQFLQNGSNVLAIQVHNESITSSDLSSRFFLSAAIKDGTMDYDPVPGWFFEPFMSSHLPFIKIDVQGMEIPDEPRIQGRMKVIYNGPGNLNFIDEPGNEYDGFISIEKRGSSSLGFPKNNFSLETQDAAGQNNNVRILGMPRENDWIIHGPFSDKSLLRNVLAYELGRKTGRYAPRTRLCEMFIDDLYYGVVVLMERIKRDDDRVDIDPIDPTAMSGDGITGGYILQVDRQEPNDGWNSPYAPNPFYEFRDPDADEMTSVHRDYIQDWITDFEDVMMSAGFNNPTTGYSQYIDVGSFIDYLIVQEMAKNIDGYRLSSYLYKDRDSKGGKLVAGPLWDFNLGFGNADYCNGGDTRGWQYSGSSACSGANPFWWGRLASDGAFKNQWKCRWRELREGPFHNDSLEAMIDNWVTEIGDAAGRNFGRWPVIGVYVWPNNFIGNSYTQEVSYLKEWLVDRADWMDLNTPGICIPSTGLEEASSLAEVTVSPNPFRTNVDFSIDGPGNPQGVIRILDPLGREVAAIPVRGNGTYQWQPGVTGTAAAVYHYRFESNGKWVRSGVLVKQ